MAEVLHGPSVSGEWYMYYPHKDGELAEETHFHYLRETERLALENRAGYVLTGKAFCDGFWLGVWVYQVGIRQRN